VLEGRWLGDEPGRCWLAVEPVSVLEGSAEAFRELPRWLDHHSGRYPEGAAIGYLSYEMARYFENLPLKPHPTLPDVSFAYYPQVKCCRAEDLRVPEPHAAREIEAAMGVEEYGQAVERIRDYIAAGDIYQANLTIPFRAQFGGERPEAVYLRSRRSRAAFRAFIKTPQRTILSDSPERFFCVQGNRILASPIKGTRARDVHDPARSQAALLASEKDRAENLMIVDLLRNDLGRVCNPGSIEARLWQTEVLPQLIHLVSHVEGTLRPQAGILEILRALFPCGSITGAPKVRAMEILAELEPAPRGISMGAIGIIPSPAASGGVRMEFSVAIRTMVIEEGTACFNVGGGIVYDSNPASEYAEVMLKAQPLFAALGKNSEW